MKYALWYRSDGEIQVKDLEIDDDFLDLAKKISPYMTNIITKTSWEDFISEIINYYNQTLGERFIIDIRNGLYKPIKYYLKCLKIYYQDYGFWDSSNPGKINFNGKAEINHLESVGSAWTHLMIVCASYHKIVDDPQLFEKIKKYKDLRSIMTKIVFYSLPLEHIMKFIKNS